MTTRWGTGLCAALLASNVLAQDVSEALKEVSWKTNNERVNNLVLAMTADEKISMVHGQKYSGAQNFAAYVNGIPHSGIPPVQLADGEAGINGMVSTTAIPTQLNVAATWSRALAYAAGKVTGKEAWYVNATTALAPRVNILRDPLVGNFWQGYSEDAFLSAQLGTQAVNGIQGQGTMADAKQIGPTGSGASDDNMSSEVDLQVLHELYWAPYEALIKAGVATVMCSYAHVNGIYACEYDELMNLTLRGDYNFSGIVMSDWGATHSTAPAIIAGLDWEQGRNHAYLTGPLYDQIYVYQNLSESYLDRAVHRILSTYDRFGLLDGRGPQGNTTAWELASNELPVEVVQESQDVAYDIAARSGILLKHGGTLPLGEAQSLAVIGPSGHQLTHGAGFAERAWGFADRKVSPLQALRSAAPSLNITSAIGVDIHGSVIPSSALQTMDGQPGLHRNDSLSTTITTDSTVDFSGTSALSGDRSYTWTGNLVAPETGWYRINLQRHYPSPGSHVLNDTDFLSLWAVDSITIGGTETNGYRLLLDGGLRQWSSPIETEDGWDETATDVYLEAGPTNLTISVPPIFGDTIEVRLSWVTPSQRTTNIATAVAAAAAVDVPVIFAHAASPAETGLQLVQGHDELIASVAAANPRTVVVLFNAEPVLMPWLDAVSSVLWMGHPGQEGGRAAADLLLGRRCPQGRLPVTYPASRNATVTRDPAYPERWNEDNATAVFSDGLNTGYRWYLYSNTSTLFPFGYGLSYTSFAYGDLAISNTSETSFEVSFTLRNTGKVAGVEVPQLYIGPPHGAATDYPGIQFAYSALTDFDSVELEVAGTSRVRFSITTRQLSFWNQTDRSWVLAHGTRQIWVGRNAEQKELVGTISV